MERYLHKFESLDAFGQAYFGNKYKEPWVSYTEEASDEESDSIVITAQNGPGEMTLVYDSEQTIDEMSGYLWTIQEMPFVFFTENRNPSVGDSIYVVTENDGEWVIGEQDIITSVEGGASTIKQVNYNKMTPERAIELGNYVEVSANWYGDERYDDQYHRYRRSFRTSLSFGPNFDNTMNSAIVFSGDANENGKFMFTYDGQEFDPNNGCSAFEKNDYSYICSSTYNTEGGYVNIKMHPRLTASRHGYLCIYDPIESKWFAEWNGMVG